MTAWDHDLTTGIAFMDDEHEALHATLRELGDLAGTRPSPGAPALDATASADVLALVDRLLDEVRRHFAHEEAVMGEFEYPSRHMHAAQHEQFVLELAALRATHADGGPAVAGRVVKYVQVWFARHTLDADTPFATWLTRTHPDHHFGHTTGTGADATRS